jgi:hypothetical protein
LKHGKIAAAAIALIIGAFLLQPHAQEPEPTGPVIPLRVPNTVPYDPSGTYYSGGGTGQVCADGTITQSTGRGRCSHHGGVRH